MFDDRQRNQHTHVVSAAQQLEWTRLSCFGHNVHDAVNGYIKDDRRVSRATGVCRKIVCTFSHGQKKRRDLAKFQLEHGLPQHSLITDCCTRWGSKQKMISKILEQEAANRHIFGLYRKCAHFIPLWQDLEVLESIKTTLDPLSDFTDILSGEDYVTVSSVKPLLHHLTSEVCLQGEEDTQLTKDIKKCVKTYMEHKYDDPQTSELLNIASFLDPRFKTDYINEGSLDGVKERIVFEGSEFAGPCNQLPTASESKSIQPAPNEKRRLGSLFKKSRGDAQSPSLTSHERVKIELATYLQSPKSDAESDPLLWWQSQEQNFPVLAVLVKKYLCICATSTSSERLFSTSSTGVTPKTSCLKPDMVNVLVFLSKKPLNLTCVMSCTCTSICWLHSVLRARFVVFKTCRLKTAKGNIS